MPRCVSLSKCLGRGPRGKAKGACEHGEAGAGPGLGVERRLLPRGPEVAGVREAVQSRGHQLRGLTELGADTVERRLQ